MLESLEGQKSIQQQHHSNDTGKLFTQISSSSSTQTLTWWSILQQVFEIKLFQTQEKSFKSGKEFSQNLYRDSESGHMLKTSSLRSQNITSGASGQCLT